MLFLHFFHILNAFFTFFYILSMKSQFTINKSTKTSKNRRIRNGFAPKWKIRYAVAATENQDFAFSFYTVFTT